MNLSIFIDPSIIEIPQKRGIRGPEPKKLKVHNAALKLKEYLTALEDKYWKELTIRQGTKKDINW